MAEDKPYSKDHIDAYNKITNIVPVEDTIEMNEMYDAARHDALGLIKGKRVKTYDQGVELLTDALIKFRKSSKNPNSSEDKEHRHHYANEIRTFLQQYAQSNKMDQESLEKLFKSGKIRQIFESFMDVEQESTLESKVDYETRKLLKNDEKFIKGVAEYHLDQNPAIKKQYSKYKINRMKTDYEVLLQHLKNHYKATIDSKLNDYNVPDKKEAAPKPLKKAA